MHVVLLPGLDGTGALFGPLREAFGAFGAEAGSVVTVAYPHDRALDYAALVELVSLPEEPFVLVAESFSGPIALAIAARRPPLLRAVVLVATFAGPPLSVSALLRPFVGSFLFWVALPHALIRLLLVGAAASASLVALVAATIRAVPPFVLAHRVRSVLAADAAVAAGACEVPVLYLQASGDRLVPDRCASRLRALVPQLEVRRVDGPHLLLQANPTAAVREIRVLERVGVIGSGGSRSQPPPLYAASHSLYPDGYDGAGGGDSGPRVARTMVVGGGGWRRSKASVVKRSRSR